WVYGILESTRLSGRLAYFFKNTSDNYVVKRHLINCRMGYKKRAYQALLTLAAKRSRNHTSGAHCGPISQSKHLLKKDTP
ncbi:MAG: hypothetical protein ACPHYF_08765, partial [Akkermansiaceae bacterium]